MKAPLDDRSLVYCINCGHEFLTASQYPRCSKCKSLRVVHSKVADSKKQIISIQHRMDQLEKELTAHHKMITLLRKAAKGHGLL